MPKNIQLLKRLRNTAAIINQTTENPEHKTLLTSMDFVLNELLLQDSSLFYLNYIAEGKALLREGRTIANQPHLADQFRGDLHADFRIDIFNAEIAKLHAALQETVALLDESRAPAEKSFLVRLTEWETALYNHRLEQVHPPLPEQQSKITPATLQTYLRQKFPERQNLAVQNSPYWTVASPKRPSSLKPKTQYTQTRPWSCGPSKISTCSVMTAATSPRSFTQSN